MPVSVWSHTHKTDAIMTSCHWWREHLIHVTQILWELKNIHFILTSNKSDVYQMGDFVICSWSVGRVPTPLTNELMWKLQSSSGTVGPEAGSYQCCFLMDDVTFRSENQAFSSRRGFGWDGSCTRSACRAPKQAITWANRVFPAAVGSICGTRWEEMGGSKPLKITPSMFFFLFVSPACRCSCGGKN